jgi:gas vesicle protein
VVQPIGGWYADTGVHRNLFFEQESEMDDNKGLSYFFLGLGIGVAVGMIFAPQAGAETRSLLRTRAAEGGDYVRRRGDQLREEASELIERGKSAVTRQKENLNSALDAGRQAYRDTVSGTRPESAPPDTAVPSEGI